MNSETLERIKRDMQANRFSEAALTVISLSEGLDLVAEIERLQAEVERLRKEVNALENKPLNLYLDRELENERLEAERDSLSARLDALIQVAQAVQPFINQKYIVSELRAAVDLAKGDPSPDSHSYADEVAK